MRSTSGGESFLFCKEKPGESKMFTRTPSTCRKPPYVMPKISNGGSISSVTTGENVSYHTIKCGGKRADWRGAICGSMMCAIWPRRRYLPEVPTSQQSPRSSAMWGDRQFGTRIYFSASTKKSYFTLNYRKFWVKSRCKSFGTNW